MTIIIKIITIIKNEIIQEKQNNCEKYISIEEATKNNKNIDEIFCLGLLAKNLENCGIITAIEKNPEQNDETIKQENIVLQFILNGLTEKKKYDFHFDFGEEKNNELLNNKEDEEEIKIKNETENIKIKTELNEEYYNRLINKKKAKIEKLQNDKNGKKDTIGKESKPEDNLNKIEKKENEKKQEEKKQEKENNLKKDKKNKEKKKENKIEEKEGRL